MHSLIHLGKKLYFFLNLGLLDTYCWIHSTFSIPSRWVGKQGHQVAYPGISPIADLAEGTEVKYHTYYQWVCFVLFMQSAIFYLPRYLWKTAEGGKVRLLVQGLQANILSNFSLQLISYHALVSHSVVFGLSIGTYFNLKIFTVKK